MGKGNRQLKKQMEDKTVLIWKMAIASALSWEISKLAGSEHPYLAPLSVILCLQITVNQSIRFSYHRMAGTIIGILVVVLTGEHLNINGWTLGGLILIGCFIAKWLKRDDTVLHQVALTVLLVFIMEHKSGEYPIDRFRDTLIGGIVAVLLHMAVKPPDFTKQVLKSYRELSNHLTTILSRIASWVQDGMEKTEGELLQRETKQLFQEFNHLNQLVKDAKESLKYNPLGKNSRKELQKCEEHIVYLAEGSTYISSIMQTLQSWSATGSMDPHQLALWSNQLKDLIPLFHHKENLADIHPPGIMLRFQIPEEQKKHQFPIVLYFETVQLLTKFNTLPQSKEKN